MLANPRHPVTLKTVAGKPSQQNGGQAGEFFHSMKL